MFVPIYWHDKEPAGGGDLEDNASVYGSQLFCLFLVVHGVEVAIP